MIDAARELLVAAIRARPGDATARLAFADWLEEHGEPERAELIRLELDALGSPAGSETRAGLLDQAADLLARHEVEWLGGWRDRLVDWEFRCGLLHRIRLTVGEFQQIAEELFRREPVVTVELVNDRHDALDEAAVRAAVSHPSFRWIRDCAVVNSSFSSRDPVNVWFETLAVNPHVANLVRFGPASGTDGERGAFLGVAIDEGAFAAFCTSPHLSSIRYLNLSMNHPSRRTRRPMHRLLGRATFASRLRSLRMDGCNLSAETVRSFLASRILPRLRQLDVTGNANDPDAWAPLFRESAFRSLRSVAIPATALPGYARSPLATRIRELTVECADDLDRDLAADREAWLELIDRAPPPRTLTLQCHNPGDEVFAAMRHKRWLRKARVLSISGDSQYEVYSGRTAGIGSLFGPREMKKLVRLQLHEACDRQTLDTLGAWPGVGRLESFALTDDYHGRMRPVGPTYHSRPNRVRSLLGVVVFTPEDVGQVLGRFRLDRIERLQLSFCAEYDQSSREYASRLTVDDMIRILASPALMRVTELTLGFNFLPVQAREVVQRLGDPAVLPRLKRARIYSLYEGLGPSADGLRARLGARLQTV